MAFTFYHLARMLLIAYQPRPRFALRRQGLPDGKDADSILRHVLLVCGACQSNSSVVPSLITLCHTCFICELMGIYLQAKQTDYGQGVR